MAEEPAQVRSQASSDALPLTRREAMVQILRAGCVAAGGAGLAFWLNARSTRPVAQHAEQARRDHRIASAAQWPALTVVQYPLDFPQAVVGEPRTLVAKALENLGGIARFVSRQDVVVLKPNIAWDRTPEQAANTNPELVAEVVQQCWAGRRQARHRYGRQL